MSKSIGDYIDGICDECAGNCAYCEEEGCECSCQTEHNDRCDECVECLKETVKELRTEITLLKAGSNLL